VAAKHNPPAGLTDFDRAATPADLYSKWDAWMSGQMSASPDFPAWYDNVKPPSAAVPAGRAPPWSGMPRTALILHNNDVLAAATAADAPVEFGSGPDALLVSQPPFLGAGGKVIPGLKYRPQDEYLEWVTKLDPDGIVREIWFTCEGPEYWKLIADNDRSLLVNLYAGVMGVPEAQIDPSVLYFQQNCTHNEPFSGGETLEFRKGDYNPYNPYNIEAAAHLTQGANTLGAEIALAKNGSLIWGDPPKQANPDLICCAEYGEANRFSDPTIGKEVNDLARQRFYVTLRDPVGLYIDTLDGSDFTDDGGNPIANINPYFQRVRQSPDGQMTVRAIFKVPVGIKTNKGAQARVGDLQYLGKPITKGGQVANAITMHLFAQALPGAPAQQSQPCMGHPCSDPRHPGFIVTTPVGKPCQGLAVPSLAAHLELVSAAFRGEAVRRPHGPSRAAFRG
jgi:hypothetical protein